MAQIDWLKPSVVGGHSLLSLSGESVIFVEFVVVVVATCFVCLCVRECRYITRYMALYRAPLQALRPAGSFTNTLTRRERSVAIFRCVIDFWPLAGHSPEALN